MNIPEARDPVWADVMSGKKEIAFSFLAIKILLSRLKSSVQLDSSSDNIEKCAGELRQLLIKNSHLPKVQSDIEKIVN